MCNPSWPFADVYLEEPPKKKKKNGELFYDPTIKGWVKLTGVTVSALQFLRSELRVPLFLFSYDVPVCFGQRVRLPSLSGRIFTDSLSHNG
jgi:hypothetical protein